MTFLAQTTLTPKEFGQTYHTYVNQGLENFIYGAVAVLAIIFALILVRQVLIIIARRRRPRLLFYDLASLHGVPRSLQGWLLHLARTHRLHDPAFLFVCPDLFRQIKSLELADARADKERKRLESLFAQFEKLAFGGADN
jgi:hypothetical protein